MGVISQKYGLIKA